MKKFAVLLSLLLAAVMLMTVSCSNDEKTVEDMVEEASKAFSDIGNNFKVEARDSKIAVVYTHGSVPVSEYERNKIVADLDKRFSEDILYDLFKSLKSDCPELSAVIVECYLGDNSLLSNYECPNPNKSYVDFVSETCYNNIINKSVK